MQEKWGVILNPKAGNKKVSGKQTISEALRSGGIDGLYCFSDSEGHATQIARELVSKGYRHILVVGGDGTVSEVVNGLMTSGVDTREITFAVLPSGTGNDWCRYWKIPNKVGLFLNMLAEGKTEKVDVGRIGFCQQGEPKERFFINSVGLGFDAAIVNKAESFGNWLKGLSLNYFFALVYCSFTHKSRSLNFEADTDSFSGDVYTISIANGPYTGGGIKQTPDANPTDGCFDVLLASRPTVWQTVRDISRVLFRSRFGGVLHLYRTSNVKITSSQTHLIEADGIVQDGAEAPFDFSIVPGALNMVVK